MVVHPAPAPALVRKGIRKGAAWVLPATSRQAPASALGPVQILISGFGRGSEISRLRRCVAQLGGLIINELESQVLLQGEGPTSTQPRLIARSVHRKLPAEGSQAQGVVAVSQQIASSRTCKYLEAILLGLWVLSPDWLLDSASAGYWLDEAEYELAGDTTCLGGPARGRRHGKQLFCGLRLLVQACTDRGSDGVTSTAGQPLPEDLARWAALGGAKVLTAIERLEDSEADPPHLGEELKASAARTVRRLVSTQEQRPEDLWWRRPILVVLETASWDPQQHIDAACRAAMISAHRAGWMVMPATWLMTCISQGEIVPPPNDWCPAPPELAEAELRCAPTPMRQRGSRTVTVA